jgi:hypothetical protein
MTRSSGSHLSPDEIEAWLSGGLAPEAQRHLDQCQACLDQVRADREIADLVAGLPALMPTAGFADRVMAAVIVPDPFAIRAFQAARRRILATPKSLAFAAGIALILLGSMVGSIAWSLTNQDTLASWGSWLLSQGVQAAWIGVQGVASNLIEQPWYQGVGSLVENPTRLALASALASLAYLGGLLALRRLLAVPTQQVAHASV